MPSRKVLITGGTGLLGKTLLETAPQGIQTFATYHRLAPPETWQEKFRRLDVREERSVSELLAEIQPETVIHTASIGGVDEAEKDPESVRAVNVEGTRAVLRACQQTGASLIFISSNAVFDGLHPPYKEDAPLRSVNRYGQIKIEAERLLENSGIPVLIVRPILMYGWPLEGARDNAVTRWLKRLEKRETIEVADDIVTMPLWAGDCARAVWNGFLNRRQGIAHVAGGDRVTFVEFAREVCRVFGHDPGFLKPVPSRQMAHLAPRPRDTSFDLTRLRRDFDVEPLGIREGLTRMKETRASILAGQGL